MMQPLALLLILTLTVSQFPLSTAKIVSLSDSTFDEKIITSTDVFLVAFVAPWCGHCKKLQPEFKDAAKQLEGSGVTLAMVDATVNEKLTKQFAVKGYPTLKTFKGGNPSNPTEYTGPRETGGIVAHMIALAGPPKVPELTSQKMFEKQCEGDGRVCLVVFLPHILDAGKEQREAEIKSAAAIAAELFGARVSVLWVEGGAQPALEQAFDVAPSYPTAAIISLKKRVAAPYRGAWDSRKLSKFANPATKYEGLGGFLGEPKVEQREPWDGMDGVVEEEEFSLEDLMGDDEL